MTDLVIKSLVAGDGEVLARLLNDSREAYIRYFTPFSFPAKNLEKQLNEVDKDRYWGLWLAGKLVGFFMLRGFDEGYIKPSFGVFISEEYSNSGLSKVALYYAISWCRLNHTPAMMLKVYPENTHARQSYEKAGFRLTDKCPDSGQHIMELSWD